MTTRIASSAAIGVGILSNCSLSCVCQFSTYFPLLTTYVALAVMDGLLYDLTIRPTYFIPYYYYIGHDILRFSEYIVH